MGILLQKAGWQTMVMDQGRRFTRHLGIPVSGVTDLFRYWWACGLTGHTDFSGAGPAVLEIRSGPVEILFDRPYNIALTGSPGNFYLEGQKIDSYNLYRAKKDQKLHIQSFQRNGTVYLAIDGQWGLNRYFGSAAYDILSPFPGTAGRLLKDGDYIKIVQNNKWIGHPVNSPEYIRRSTRESDQVLRITAGPELHFSDKIKGMLQEKTFLVSRQSNRMGLRLEPSPDKNVQDVPSMVSSIVLPGMIQWPSANQPILLLPNCQTTGGYPRVAKLIDADMWKLAYIGPGDKLRFKWTTREQALYLRNYKMGQFTREWNQTFPWSIINHRLVY